MTSCIFWWMRLALLDVGAAKLNEQRDGQRTIPAGYDAGIAHLLLCQWVVQFRGRSSGRLINIFSVRYLTADTHPDHDCDCQILAGKTGRCSVRFLCSCCNWRGRPACSNWGCWPWMELKLEANATKRKTGPTPRASADGAGSAGRLRLGELLAAAETAESTGRRWAALCPRHWLMRKNAGSDCRPPRPNWKSGPKAGYAEREAQARERPRGDKPRRVAPTPRGTDTLNPTDPDSTFDAEQPNNAISKVIMPNWWWSNGGLGLDRSSRCGA